MKKIIVFYLPFLFLLASCSKSDDALEKDCIDTIFKENDMKPQNKIKDSGSYLVLYEWKGKQFFEFDLVCHHCGMVKLADVFIDCDGNKINCPYQGKKDSDCKCFYKESVKKGIIGFRKL